MFPPGVLEGRWWADGMLMFVVCAVFSRAGDDKFSYAYSRWATAPREGGNGPCYFVCCTRAMD